VSRIIRGKEMRKGSQNWDSEKLSQEFFAKAKTCERYLDEIRAKLHVTRSFELIFDEALAEFYVFDYLHGKPFLATRDQFLAGLRGLLKMEVPKALGILDFERFKVVRQNIIENLIRRFEKDDASPLSKGKP
jgi:hypothetical protein